MVSRSASGTEIETPETPTAPDGCFVQRIVVDHLRVGFFDTLLNHRKVLFERESVRPVNHYVLFLLSPPMRLALLGIQAILKCDEFDVDSVRKFNEFVDRAAVRVGAAVNYCEHIFQAFGKLLEGLIRDQNDDMVKNGSERPIVRDLLHKILEIPQQQLWLLQCSKMAATVMRTMEHQISGRRYPALGDRSKLVWKPAISQWLGDPPIRLLVRADVVWSEALAVGVDGCWEGVR
ncbi:hypothetical protein HG530_006815 [Fusarium avenaceum]|nr:hypothetical protein HG530_006815 [Fusarium avenaceum]